jgi:hypothetical protein
MGGAGEGTCTYASWGRQGLMPVHRADGALRCQLKLRLSAAQRAELRALALDQHVSVSHLLRHLIAREIGESRLGVGTRRDESVIRDAAILIAVEQVLKLQEATIPGGITRSRQVLDAAAEAAMARLATAEEVLGRQDRE